MKVYREQLLAARKNEDPFAVSCWPRKGQEVFQGKTLAKALGKYGGYPLRVMATPKTEIVHFLDHSIGYLIPRVGKGKKIVATLHDLIPLRYAANLKSEQLERFRHSVSQLRLCDALVAVSEYSKGEAVELLGIPEEKIHVVPNGVNAPPNLDSSKCERARRLREKGADVVVLSVGSTQRRKNLEILPESLRVLREETGLRVALLRVGGALNGSLVAELKGVCGDEFFIEAGRLNEEQLWNSYSACDMVFVPSFYEGFGLPVIEGLACGKGVAASNRSSLPEVGGEWAEYFDPDSGEEAGKALARVALQRNDLERAQQRREAVAGLTWRRHLEGIYEVYERLSEE